MTGRQRWGTGLEGQRIDGYRVTVIERTRRGDTKRATFVAIDEDDERGAHWERATTRPVAWSGAELVFTTEPLPAVVPLARGVDIPAATLVFILDALTTEGRHNVDLADIKTVVSQLGSRIATLGDLPEEQRNPASAALRVAILRLCAVLSAMPAH